MNLSSRSPGLIASISLLVSHQVGSRQPEDLVEHLLGEFPRKRVSGTGVEAANQAPAADIHLDLRSMPKLGRRAFQPFRVHRVIDDPFPCGLSQGDNDLCRRQGKCPLEPCGTVCNLIRRGFICRWSAMTGIRNCAIHQPQSVIGRFRRRLAGKPSFMQGAIQPVSAAIPRKRSTCAIAAVRCGSQADDQ